MQQRLKPITADDYVRVLCDFQSATASAASGRTSLNAPHPKDRAGSGTDQEPRWQMRLVLHRQIKPQLFQQRLQFCKRQQKAVADHVHRNSRKETSCRKTNPSQDKSQQKRGRKTFQCQRLINNDVKSCEQKGAHQQRESPSTGRSMQGAH